MKRTFISVGISIGLALGLAACSGHDDSIMQGYGEADYIYLASQEAGVVAELYVREGDAVAAGAPIFRLNPERIDLPLQGATAQRSALAQAVNAARANATLAERNLARSSELFRQGYMPRARLDADRAARDSANAQLAEARRQIDASNAEIGLWQERRADMSGAAPTSGTIERVYHRAGEVVAAGAPIAALLAPQNEKVRFFAPQSMLAQLPMGARVAISCDGCAENLTGTVSYVATEPQFTPPVIYSLDQREKLVFLIEARPDNPGSIRPGIPVDVRIVS